MSEESPSDLPPINTNQADGSGVPPAESFLIVDTAQTPRNELYLQSYLTRKTLPPSFDRPGLMQYMQRLSIDAVMRGDYGEANEWAEMNRKFYDECLEREGHERIKSQMRTIEDQKSMAQDEMKEVEAKWKKIFREVRRLEKERLHVLTEKHTRELREFDEYWKSDDALRPFTKQSSELLNLRVKEKQMMLLKMFQDAAMCGKHADRLEQGETRQAQVKAEKEAVFQRRKIVAKHDKEIQLLQRKAEMRFRALEKNKNHEVEIVRIRIAKIESNSSCVRRAKWEDAEAACKMRAQTPDAGGVLSPRSHLRLDQYRKTSTVSRLVMRPIRKFPKCTTRSLRMPKYEKKK